MAMGWVGRHTEGGGAIASRRAATSDGSEALRVKRDPSRQNHHEFTGARADVSRETSMQSRRTA